MRFANEIAYPFAATSSGPTITSVFFEDVQVKVFSSEWLHPASSESDGTSAVPISGTVSVVSLPKGLQIHGWRLKSLLLAILEADEEGVVANAWLYGVNEYGTGQTEEEAITDLVHSLGEYRQSLEERECRLSPSAKSDLLQLRALVEPA